MIRHVPVDSSQVDEIEWVGFPGGELEGRRPKALCPSCRRHAVRAALCFQCYRLELDRQGALKAAGALDTASEARFQTTLPFEPVNVARLERLRAERATARAELRSGAGPFEDRRRRAQIAARHALQPVVASVEAHRSAGAAPREFENERAAILAAAAHAAELQLPDAWLPFVVAR